MSTKPSSSSLLQVNKVFSSCSLVLSLSDDLPNKKNPEWLENNERTSLFKIQYSWLKIPAFPPTKPISSTLSANRPLRMLCPPGNCLPLKETPILIFLCSLLLPLVKLINLLLLAQRNSYYFLTLLLNSFDSYFRGSLKFS